MPFWEPEETMRNNIVKKVPKRKQRHYSSWPDHEEVRTNEDPEAHDYWEAGLTTDTISALKTGNVDHSQKSCYHCNRKGHIKANCPERRKLGARPWTKRPGPRGKKTIP